MGLFAMLSGARGGRGPLFRRPPSTKSYTHVIIATVVLVQLLNWAAFVAAQAPGGQQQGPDDEFGPRLDEVPGNSAGNAAATTSGAPGVQYVSISFVKPPPMKAGGTTVSGSVVPLFSKSPPSPPAPKPPPAPPNLAKGFVNWSWDALIDPTIRDVPQYEGRLESFGQYSIGVMTQALGGLGIGNPSGFPSDPQFLSFCLKPGETKGYTLAVVMEDTSADTRLSSEDMIVPEESRDALLGMNSAETEGLERFGSGLVFSAQPGEGWRCIMVDLESSGVENFLETSNWDKLAFRDVSGLGSEFEIADIAVKVKSDSGGVAVGPAANS